MRFERACVAAAASACLFGCLRFDPFACSDDAQCDRDGQLGACQSTGYCAYPDIGCPTGLRYDDHAGNGLAGTCVAPPADTDVLESSDSGSTSDDAEDTTSESTGASAVESDTDADCGGPGQACCDGGGCADDLTCAGSACGCVVEIAAGDRHSCAIKVDGTVWCWGNNAQAQVRTPAGEPELMPVVVSGATGLTTKATALSAHDHTCALRDDALAVCWGANGAGQSDPEGVATSEPRVAMWAQPATGIGAGGQHTCAVLSDETSATCWGNNDLGQLTGNEPGPGPVDVPLAFTLEQIAVGLGHGCATTQEGALWCWGDNAQGQLAQDPMLVPTSATPVEVELPAVDEIALGGRHTCARSGDEVWCWGRNAHGQLGDGTGTMQWMPAQVALPPGLTVASLASGVDHTCVLDAGGSLWCWGSNTSGQLMLEPDPDTGDDTRTLVPVEIEVGASVLAFTGGGTHSCALVDTGEIVCWGTNTHGQIGDGGTSYAHAPREVLLACP